MFSRCSVRIVPFVDVFLMYFWEEVCSTSFFSAILTGDSQSKFSNANKIKLELSKSFKTILKKTKLEDLDHLTDAIL